MSEFNEERFKRWYGIIAQLTGLDPDPDNMNHQYDYRGFYGKYVSGKDDEHIHEVFDAVKSNKNVHVFTDEYKLPGHPTFSIESIYNDSTKGIIGGSWISDSIFVPSGFNTRNNGEKWKIIK